MSTTAKLKLRILQNNKSLSFRTNILAATILALGMPATAIATDGSENIRTWNLPAQPLHNAIESLSRQSGTNVSLDKSTDGKQAPALQGSYSVKRALDILLRESGLVATKNGDGSWRVHLPATSTHATAADAITIDTIHVFAKLSDQVGIGSKWAQSLRETPKSVTIFTNERMNEQNLQNLQEVLIQTTGVTVGAFTPLDTFYYSRGMQLTTYQFDAGAPALVGSMGFYYTPDTATLERVELLRGVDGMYSGAGEPGGVINLVRKRPTREKSIQLDLSGGTWDNYRGVIDASGPLGLDGRLRGRSVLSLTDRGYFQDNYTSEKQIAYGVLEFDATDSTLLTFGINYENREDDGYPGWAGTARYTDGGTLELPREYSYAPDWARWHIETTEIFTKLEQRHGQSGVVKLDLRRIEQESENKQVLIYGAVDRSTGAGSTLYGSHGTNTPVQHLADLSASGEFNWFGHDHRYTIGVDYAQLDSAGQKSYTTDGLSYSDGMQLDYWNFDPDTLAEPDAILSGTYPILEQTQRGYYATLGLQLADPLRLTVGGRYGKYRYHQVYVAASTGNTTVQFYKDSSFIPSASLSYDLSEDWTAYLSYGETFKVQSNLLAAPEPGSPLDPMTGDNLELGVKGEIFSGGTMSLALYRLTRSGEGTLDPAYAAAISDPSDGSACCYIAQGEVVVKGMDVEFSGALTPALQVFGGYTYTHTDFEGSSSVSYALSRTPKHQIKLWATYQMPGRFARWTVNGGLVAQSNTSYGQIHYGGRTLFNAGVRYRINSNWSAALSGDNLTDKEYRHTTGDLNRENVWGDPRSVTFSLRGRW